MARAAGLECYALSVSYGQRHQAEISAAARVAHALGAREHRIMHVNLGRIGGSALTDNSIDVPETPGEGIPVTYVPARNTIMLSLALAWAEVLKAGEIHIGVNAVDYSGLSGLPSGIRGRVRAARARLRPRREWRARRCASTRRSFDMSKAQIVREGVRLGVDYSLTVSCYQADDAGRACGLCDSCRLRREGFVSAGIPDPTRYRL